MNDETLQSKIGTQDLNITPESMTYLYTSAKWAKFLAIVGFVSVGLLVIIAFFSGAIMSSMGSMYASVSGITMTTIYLIMAVIYFFPVLFAYRFAINLENAIVAKNTPKLTESFKNLSYYCQYVGILTVIALVLLVIGIIIGIIGIIALQ